MNKAKRIDDVSTSSTGIAQRFGSGQSVQRIEDEGLLKGLGQYADDLMPEGQLRLLFVRSPHPHARILSIDTAQARAMPGVAAVLTGADLQAAGIKPMAGTSGFKRPDGGPGTSAPRQVLAHEMVRFVGDAVALVVAETLQQARDAAEAVWVDYEPLPHVTEGADAIAPGAPQL
nr:xanthine dehydrogenase family protein molybdopterin-binding subunit [Ramlibacter sp.]